MSLLTSLVSYWRMDEASGDALDAHGSNDLTDNNTVGSGTGIISNARDFESTTTEYFSHADNADLSLGADTDFTWAMWVQLESKGAERIFVSKSTPDTPTAAKHFEYRVCFVNAANRFRFDVGNGSSSASVDANNLGIPSLATWYFIGAWHDSAGNTINIQVNDGTVDSAAWSGGTQDGTGTMRLGRQPSSNYHDGLLDEVGFWKRVLTSQERTDLYNSGAGLSYDNFGGAAGQPAIKRMGGVKFGSGPFQLVSGMKGW